MNLGLLKGDEALLANIEPTKPRVPLALLKPSARGTGIAKKRRRWRADLRRKLVEHQTIKGDREGSSFVGRLERYPKPYGAVLGQVLEQIGRDLLSVQPIAHLGHWGHQAAVPANFYGSHAEASENVQNSQPNPSTFGWENFQHWLKRKRLAVKFSASRAFISLEADAE